MVVSNDHRGSLSELDEATRTEMMALLASSERLMMETMAPQGFNMGINIGEVAGAGIKEHIHIHLVPRWGGDTNFFTTLSETRAVPESLKETYERLLPGFEKLNLI